MERAPASEYEMDVGDLTRIGRKKKTGGREAVATRFWGKEKQFRLHFSPCCGSPTAHQMSEHKRLLFFRVIEASSPLVFCFKHRVENTREVHRHSMASRKVPPSSTQAKLGGISLVTDGRRIRPKIRLERWTPPEPVPGVCRIAVDLRRHGLEAPRYAGIIGLVVGVRLYSWMSRVLLKNVSGRSPKGKGSTGLPELTTGIS